MIALRRLCPVLLVLVVAACGAEPPVALRGVPSDAKYEPAPVPHGPYVRRGGTLGAFEMPVPPKMPLGTGAVPVSGSPVRGSIVTGLRQSF